MASINNQTLRFLVVICAILVLAASAFANTCDEVCANAGEPGYNKATDGTSVSVCCCQPDQGSQGFTNHPESECSGINPQATPAAPAQE